MERNGWGNKRGAPPGVLWCWGCRATCDRRVHRKLICEYFTDWRCVCAVFVFTPRCGTCWLRCVAMRRLSSQTSCTTSFCDWQCGAPIGQSSATSSSAMDVGWWQLTLVISVLESPTEPQIEKKQHRVAKRSFHKPGNKICEAPPPPPPPRWGKHTRKTRSQLVGKKQRSRFTMWFPK